MNFLQALYKREHAHLKKLNTDGRQLIKTIFLFNLISPLFSIFLAAFLLRKTEDIMLVALFHLIMYSFIPAGFYLNGVLLRKYKANKLFVIGLVLKALAVATLIFLPNLTVLILGIYGMVYGVALGMYWANRNYLTLISTKSNNRIYFSGLESFSKSICDVITPYLIGLVITFGTAINLYSPQTGYKILAVFMLFAVAYICISITKLHTPLKAVTLFVKENSKQWRTFRLYNLVLGFLSVWTLMFPPILVLSLVGDESALGTIQSLAALLSAFVVYRVSKSMAVKHRFTFLTISVALGIIGALCLIWMYSAVGVILLIACITVGQPFWWGYMSSMTYDFIGKDSSQNYAGVCDREIYLNIGRVGAILIFMLLLHLYTSVIALSYMPFAYATFQICLFFVARTIEKTQTKQYTVSIA